MGKVSFNNSFSINYIIKHFNQQLDTMKKVKFLVAHNSLEFKDLEQSMETFSLDPSPHVLHIADLVLTNLCLYDNISIDKIFQYGINHTSWLTSHIGCSNI